MKRVHILLDGSDNLGKTTIANKLSIALSLPVIKMPNMKEYIEAGHPEEFSKLFNETIIQFRKTSFIMDRGFTSSLVYSRVFSRKFDLEYLKTIEEILKPIVIIFTGRHTDKRGKSIYTSFTFDEVYSEDKKSSIDQEFCKMAIKRGYNVVSVHGKSEIVILEEVLRIIKNGL